ncbi:hypothetical protein GIY30_13180 [Gordonia sp. HNM0687]|uniref:Squalene cyclase C-terminal domain-containing protein n=1 Tax=Gordonia mangrovi TaxID=2665643 RepID=A0A6L7GUF2_9ACTN|nr:hypothetical protein [Gordonia mangrovi]
MTWLLDGDPAVAYQATRDLLGVDDARLQVRIADEGAGATLLAARGPDGHWGAGFYNPKWTSTHYTLLELRGLGLAPTHPVARDACALVLRDHKVRDGGVDPRPTTRHSDVCVNGMALNYLSWFGSDADQLASIVDVILAEQMPDGGFNCRTSRTGATHSSVHTSTSVIEGITAYEQAGYSHRRAELRDARTSAVEFLLRHRLFRSERTGKPIRPDFTRLHYPARWYFDVLRGLDALRAAGIDYDERMRDACSVLEKRRRSDGRWVAQRGYPGKTHLTYPPPGEPNPWVTLIALRVLRAYA